MVSNHGNRRFVIVVLIFMTCSVNAQSAHFYIAPNGNDAWSGTLSRPNETETDGPFASIQVAVEVARRTGIGTEQTIIVINGDYFLSKPIVLNAQDKGIKIIGLGEHKPVLYGGHPVTGWVRDGKIYWATVEGVKEGKWDFRALVVNGKLAPRARFPEQGSLAHESRFDVSWMSTTGGGWKRKPTIEELTTMQFRSGDLPVDLDPANAEITVYHMWDESLVGVKNLDHVNHTITFSNPSGHPPGAFGVRKYVVWNTKEGMTHPGQWFLDRTAGRIVYWPFPDEDMNTARVIAPTMEAILRLDNTEDVEIRGLRLTVTNTPLKAGGFGAGAFDGAVSVCRSRNCRLIDLEISHTAGQGICIRDGGGWIERSHIHDIGACGIKAPSCRIEDNYVHHIGRIYPSAIGIWGGGKSCIISHNEIHDTPYSAINCGGENHRIEYNKIYRAMLELHDGGAVYVFAGKNTVLRNNMAFDIPDTGGYGSSAYYLDERSADCIVEGNLSYGIQRPSHNHMAHGNTIRNNVFIFDGDMQLTFHKSDGFLFEDNVLFAEGKITFSFAPGAIDFRNNVLHSRIGQLLQDRLKDYSSEKTTAIPLSDDNKTEDPWIESWQSGWIIYSARSPVSAMGIKPVDVRGAGRDWK
ncbi:MAG: right-handed parallel beta-helix repeat-containing protein [Sedimentisphaerales bacterium]|nr:right-handed parallel beta-helix repeat-containing protein [Sedimentisphaerales bacterium]